MIAVSAPVGNSTETPSRAVTAASPSPNTRRTSVALTIVLLSVWTADWLKSFLSNRVRRQSSRASGRGSIGDHPGNPGALPSGDTVLTVHGSVEPQPGGLSTVGGTSAIPTARYRVALGLATSQRPPSRTR